MSVGPFKLMHWKPSGGFHLIQAMDLLMFSLRTEALSDLKLIINI